jgi:hypothetical protein
METVVGQARIHTGEKDKGLWLYPVSILCRKTFAGFIKVSIILLVKTFPSFTFYPIKCRYIINNKPRC